ncbi:7TMR-DISMED2 domain-containing protein [Chondrinema litorale]|uniref:7TMR-DISMED2 domain-containing protein n=1 Tax=Chondrinema litorale TaxID=2994555 RepID=UPI002542C5D2|nr:7TM-DISM domain-containing protein [Chondrinema litorale]UZR99563.1 hypothetical protein OQ292_37500 [Chondrinema litorale]
MRLLFTFLLLIFSKFLLAQDRVFINKDMHDFPSLESYILLYHDTSKNKQIAEIASRKFKDNFEPYNKINASKRANSIYWGRILINNNGATAINLFLILDGNNYVTLYEESGEIGFKEKFSGELEQASLKDVRGSRKEAIFEITLLPNQEKLFYYKVENITGFKPSLNIRLVKPKTWYTQDKSLFIKDSLFQGMLFIMAVYSGNSLPLNPGKSLPVFFRKVNAC